MSCNKMSYDKKGAVTALRASLRRRKHRPKFLRKYYCAHCNAWHLTHRENR